MFVLTTVTRDCKNGDLYVSVDDNAYLTKEAASTCLTTITSTPISG